MSKPSLDFLANLLGASRGGAGGIELEVIVDVLKESRIILLAKMDDREELMNHGDVGSKGAGLGGAGLGLGKIAFANLELGDLGVSHRGAGPLVEGMSLVFRAARGLTRIDEQRAEGNVRVAELAIAQVERLPKAAHGVGGLLQFQIGHTGFVFCLVAAG